MCELCNETGWREHTESDEMMGLITVSEMCTCLENDECPRCGGMVTKEDIDGNTRRKKMYCLYCDEWHEVE